MIQSIIVLVLISQISCFVLTEKACSVAISDLDPEPIVLTTNNEFIYPEPGADRIGLQANEQISIACPGNTVTINSKSYKTVQATCSSGSTFLVNGEQVDFRQIACTKKVSNTARYTGESCESNGKEIEIGYLLNDDTFVRQIRICFDPIEQNSLYSEYKLSKSIGSEQTGVARPSFVQDSFYKVTGTVNSLYTKATQRKTINKLLGLAESSTKYVQNNNYYLARGHLTAKADFVYGPQQSATFHYVNAAPQWQTFNGGNWEQLEADVRDYAAAKVLDLTVYTGTYGVTTLPHAVTGKDVRLYLYVNGDERGIPVPELYWKVVYNPATKQGVAFVGINNPYQSDVEKSIICEDVSEQIDWLNWDAKNLQSGYSYVCDVNDLKKTVTYLPEIEVVSLLK